MQHAWTMVNHSAHFQAVLATILPANKRFGLFLRQSFGEIFHKIPARDIQGFSIENNNKLLISF